MQDLKSASNYQFSNVVVGDELGLIKKFEINNILNETKFSKVITVNRDLLDQPSTDKGVLTIKRFVEPHYLNKESNSVDPHDNIFLICSKTNRIQIYNAENNNFFDVIPQKKHELSSSIPFQKKFIINCYKNGTINLQNIEKEFIQFSNESNKKALKILGIDENINQNIYFKNDTSTTCHDKTLNKNLKREKIFDGSNESLSKKGKFTYKTFLSDRLIYNPNFNTSNTTLDCFELEKKYLAIGGKNNNLKVFDIETENCTFIAKNTESNWLSINRQVWISGISWLDNYPSSIIAVTSRSEPIIKLYDIRSSVKPVMALNMKEKSTYHSNPPVFTTICSIKNNFTENKNNNQLIVGSTIGRMILIDLRLNTQTYQTLCSFKGFSGSIRDIKYIPESNKKSKIVSCCLDRFIRIHTFENSYDKIRELTGKYYFKTKLTCLQPIFIDLTKNKQKESNQD